ncbi:MAG: rhodanese-like domain-containing protein [Nakamurella sp.]
MDVAELAAALRSPHPPVVLDVRWSLAGNGYDAFLSGRIPGAKFVDLDRDLAAPAGIGGRHPLPEPEVLAALLARTGVTEEQPVVVCGQRDTSIAARGWWLLRWIGHRDVRVLDGGFEAWRNAGFATAGPDTKTSVAEAPPTAGDDGAPFDAGDWPAKSDLQKLTAGAMSIVDADGAAALGLDADAALLDARAAERYRGDIEPVDPVAGHIPGAVNIPLAAVHQPDGRLLPAAELRDVFEAVGMRAGVVAAASCGSGVTACSLVLAAEVIGLTVALYPGSYSGWCALGRPVVRE